MQHFEPYDPLTKGDDDVSLILAARKRHIRNILKSYTGRYDVFAELLQNALDAVEKRAYEEGVEYDPKIWVKVDIKNREISVTDNGCGMEFSEYQTFLRPEITFKSGDRNRGMKGVGATYVAYGFNSFQVSTKTTANSWSGVLRRGREWVEDKSETIATPKFVSSDVEPPHLPFRDVDKGTSVTVRLVGDHIRPRDLAWNGATTAKQWLSLFRVHTPIGAIYIPPEQPFIPIEINVEVVSNDGQVSKETVENPAYLYPHQLFNSVLNLREFLAWMEDKADKKETTDRRPPRFMNQTGYWAQADTIELISNGGLFDVPLDEDQIELAKKVKVQLYIFMGSSTELWVRVNEDLGLHRRTPLIKGGLQIATRHMPQGEPIQIPLTRYIGLQNQAHVIIHIDAEPDLGRKGFQPEHVALAKHFAQRVVTSFGRKYKSLLRQDSSVIDMVRGGKLETWIDEQKLHERQKPLRIDKKHFFEPVGYLPTTSVPRSEQDVVALFNQLLSTGVIRGIEIISSSQYEQYDSLYRFVLEPPFSKYEFDESLNPLGVIKEALPLSDERIPGRVEVLEYKLKLDDLIEEFANEYKDANTINLVVAWDMGTKWKSIYSVTSYLTRRNVHHRKNHGVTHRFENAVHGGGVFYAIILESLVNYLNDPESEEMRQLPLGD